MSRADAVLAMTADRRDLHAHAEPGWCEVRTASLVARRLAGLGYAVRVGREVVAADRPGLPPAAELAAAYDRALAAGADPEYAALVRDGFTGVVATLATGRPGPVVALRFDIDANYGHESADPAHPAERDGYRSRVDGVHHSCGHDAHTAIGLAVAHELAAAGGPSAGEVRLIFQPAEEGLRGGPAMVAAGVADGVDVLLGCHIGVQARETGEVVAGYRRILASHKFDVRFRGRNAHAGISPHEGRNAVQAAAIAVQNLLAISRHGDGETRVNVGTIEGGETRNSVPAHALLRCEVRADDNAILGYLCDRVEEVVRGAAAVTGVEARVETAGGAAGADSTPELAAVVGRVAAGVHGVTRVRDTADFKGSDDMSSFMNAVQDAGGRAVYFGLGSRLGDVHHAPGFDVDDDALVIGRDVFLGCLRELGVLG
ncbi:amidohydrolase [Jiangella alba]|uniref:Aminobenzoyl-glutamate utilization protein A n=1 Tax=Jiangella alba TaxID=561176 RepID=A0A1H5KU35_9ACTN|nr:amidohydrolase [Jiangella alba]SEE68243.1 aminobenzoyl-glutamate utilization protein A [Jiangella alba]